MASFSWKTGVNGDWNTAADWASGTVPNDVAADVTIDALPTATDYTVTIAAGESETVNSLTMNGATNLKGVNTSPYNAAKFEMDGTLTFAPGSTGVVGGSLQTFLITHGGTFVNVGSIDGFIQADGNVLFTGTNGFYVTNWLQELGIGTVTVDTKSIAEMTGNTLFDGIYEAKGQGSVIDLGGKLQGNIVNIATIEGPPLIADGWTELLLNDPSAQINEWNGTTYVALESTLTDIGSRGTLDVLAARNYATTNALSVESGGMLNLQAGNVTVAALNINAGGIVQGYATLTNGVVNNGTLIAVGGDLDVVGALTGTGVVNFDKNIQTGTITPGGTLEVHTVAATQTIVMTGSDTLQLDTPTAFAGSIQATSGDKIVLQGVTATSAVVTNGTLVVSNGTQTVASLKLSGTTATENFTTNGSIISVGTASAVPHFTITDTTTNVTTTDPGTAYSGPVAGLNWQYATVTADSLAVTATAPNSFIHTGSGTDAIDVSHVNGTNVLDGSTGSNFLVGGTGFDTFFLDDRGATADVFSTVVNFHSGDDATVFGVTKTDFTLNTYDNQGAVGSLGLDFSFTAPGKANANLVLAGFSNADLASGKLTVTYGATAATATLPSATYMLIHAN